MVGYREAETRRCIVCDSADFQRTVLWTVCGVYAAGCLHTTEVHEQNAGLLLLIPVRVEDGALCTSVWPTQCVCSFSASKQGISFNRT